MKQTVLIANGYPKTVTEYKPFLESSFSLIETAITKNCLTLAKKENPNLILLDSKAQTKTALSLCRSLKTDSQTKDIPVVLVNSLDKNNEIQALTVGADDCIRSPIDQDILLLRMKMLLKKAGYPKFNDNVLSIDNLLLFINPLRVKLGQRMIPLTAKQFDLLYFLLKNKGKTFSRKTIFKVIWRYAVEPQNTRAVDMFVSRLRVVLGKDHGRSIQSNHGQGYFYSPVLAPSSAEKLIF